jgi:hypothetical protein
VAVAKISTESLADTETSHEEVGSTAHWPETKYGTLVVDLTIFFFAKACMICIIL